jgi:hypothetical protein
MKGYFPLFSISTVLSATPWTLIFLEISLVDRGGGEGELRIKVVGCDFRGGNHFSVFEGELLLDSSIEELRQSNKKDREYESDMGVFFLLSAIFME